MGKDGNVFGAEGLCGNIWFIVEIYKWLGLFYWRSYYWVKYL